MTRIARISALAVAAAMGTSLMAGCTAPIPDEAANVVEEGVHAAGEALSSVTLDVADDGSMRGVFGLLTLETDPPGEDGASAARLVTTEDGKVLMEGSARFTGDSASVRLGSGVLSAEALLAKGDDGMWRGNLSVPASSE